MFGLAGFEKRNGAAKHRAVARNNAGGVVVNGQVATTGGGGRRWCVAGGHCGKAFISFALVRGRSRQSNRKNACAIIKVKSST